MELGHAKETITGLEEKLRDMSDDRDQKLMETTTKFEESRNKAHDFEVELERISAKYSDAVEDGQTRLEEAEKKPTKSKYGLRRSQR